MDFTFTEEQFLLKQSVGDFIKNEYDFDKRRKIVESEEGFSRKHWQTFADLDWNSIPFSEKDGGYGAGAFFRRGASVAQKATHIPAFIAGSQIYAVAFSEIQSRFDLFDVTTTAHKEGANYILDGEKIFVMGGHLADKLLVVARTAGEQREQEGISIFLVDANAPGISKTLFRTVDGFKAVDIRFDQVKVHADI